MDYAQTIDYLYNAAPLFQNIGAGAYKEGLTNTRILDQHFNHPHSHYHTIHVAGTNGKGSVSSMLASILQSAGFKVGLYTSPHLVDFRERIRVNGEMIPEQRVVDFVAQERDFFKPLSPSFFELTTALAFLYFEEQQVDVAVVEVGLGGRLDCTNIIVPDVSVITNISFDHQQFLGNTLAAIAAEKAGIMKPGIPVVIGETNGHPEVRNVFQQTFATLSHQTTISGVLRFADEEQFQFVEGELQGDYQRANIRTVQCVVDELRKQPFYASRLTQDVVADGLATVSEHTGLRGRWQRVGVRPTIVCDVGHNAAGITYVVEQLHRQVAPCLHIVFGMVDDKDYEQALTLYERVRDRAVFYITQPSSKRALAANVLAAAAHKHGLDVRVCVPTIQQAVGAALAAACPDDFILISGSCYLVADYFSMGAA